MDIPIKINLFNKIKKFQEIDKLRQVENGQKSSPGAPTTIEEEIKILRWAYSNHKNLFSGINKNTQINGLSNTTQQAIDHALKNLVIREYATKDKNKKNGYSIILNPRGLSFGEVLHELYNLDQEKLRKNYFIYLSYQCLIICSWLLILFGLTALSIQISDKTGLLDNLKLFFRDEISNNPNYYYFILILPIIFFISSLVLRFINWIINLFKFLVAKFFNSFKNS